MVGLDSVGQLVASWWVVWRLWVVLWCGLISISEIFVGSGVVSGCSGIGLVVQQLGQ